MKCAAQYHRDNPTQRQCKRCSRPFQCLVIGKKMFCSRECREAAYINPNPRPLVALLAHNCKICGTEFFNKKLHVAFCSRKCQVLPPAKNTTNVAATAPVDKTELLALRAKKRRDYMRQYNKGVRWSPSGKTCDVCKKQYVEKNPLQRYCSDECFRSVDAAWSARRQRRMQIGEHIDRRAVFIRDNGECHLCKQPVDFDLKWPHPMSRTLDHVIPISHGGQHTYENVRLAHMWCNTSKGNRVNYGS